jgi:hypothetical protein
MSRAKQAASAAASRADSGGVRRVLTESARGALTIRMQTGRGMRSGFGLRLIR